MKETKAFLKNQNQIYTNDMLNHLKDGHLNYLYVRDLCNMVIANSITLKGLEKAKIKTNGER